MLLFWLPALRARQRPFRRAAMSEPGPGAFQRKEAGRTPRGASSRAGLQPKPRPAAREIKDQVVGDNRFMGNLFLGANRV